MRQQNYGGTSDDMASIGRAVVEALTELRLTLRTTSGRLASFRPLTGGDELLYSATSVVRLKTVFVTNVSGATTNARIYHVPAGGSAGQGNALYFDFPIATGAVLFFQPDIDLAAGDTLWVRSSTGGNLTFNIYGV